MSQPFRLSDSDLVIRLWDQQNGLCALCGEQMLRNRFEAPHARVWTKQRATLDHMHPKTKGGSDAVENLQLTHARCNKIKGNRL